MICPGGTLMIAHTRAWLPRRGANGHRAGRGGYTKMKKSRIATHSAATMTSPATLGLRDRRVGTYRIDLLAGSGSDELPT